MRAGLPALYPRLWRFALVLTRDRAAADDLAQAGCVRALAQAAKFRPGTNLGAWVFTLTRRLWLNEMRAGKVRRGAGLVDAHDTDIADEKADTEANIFAREVLDKVQALPEGQRLTVLLVYLEGYSYREAAEMLEIPIGTVMSRLAAARGQLAPLMRDGRRT